MRTHTTRHSVIYVLLLVLFTLSILIGALPQKVSALGSMPCQTIHSVRSGDTLSKIAKRYGVSSYRIVKANDLTKPYRIHVGQKLCIPYVAVNEDDLPDLSNRYGNQAASYFTVRWVPKGIAIKPVNFPKKSNFTVKINDSVDRTGKWYRLGLLNTLRYDGKEAVFKLPKGLSRKQGLTVCLKDRRSDVLHCRYLLPDY